MKKLCIHILIITSLYISNCSKDTARQDIYGTANEPKDPFTEMYKNGLTSSPSDFDIYKEIEEDTIMNILWSGNGLVNKKDRKYTHPVYFANLTDLYLLNEEGVHLYNNEKDRLITINEHNILNKINNLFRIEANNYIMLSISSDTQRLLKGIEYTIMKKFGNKKLLENIKLAHIDQKKQIQEEAIIEAGSIANNIMLSASTQNLAYYPINILNKANITKTILKIKQKLSTPLTLIPIAHKKNNKKENKDNENNENKKELMLEYLFKLIKTQSPKLKENKYHKDFIKSGEIIKLLWAGNGLVENGNNNTVYVSGTEESFINLYYIMPKTVEKYDPISNSLTLTKTSPYKHRLKKILRKYNVSNSILITIKKHKKTARKKRYIRNITLFQTGVALQNIQNRAAAIGIKHRFLKIPIDKRKELSDNLLLKKGNEPIFIIPIARNVKQK